MIGSVDKTVRLWDVAQGTCLKTFAGHQEYANATQANSFSFMYTHGSAVLCVDIAPDGLTVVSGSKDCTMKLWSVQTGQCIATFNAFKK